MSTSSIYVCCVTVSFHNFKSQNLKLSVSNPKSKYVAYVSVLSQTSSCQGLGRKNKHENLKTDRITDGTWGPATPCGPCILFSTYLFLSILTCQIYLLVFMNLLLSFSCLYIYIYIHTYQIHKLPICINIKT